MLRKYFLIVLLTLTALARAHPVYAQAATVIYVDTSYTGTEDGTQSRPYNTIIEAMAVAQAFPSGAFIYIKQEDGSWKFAFYVPPVSPGATGGDGGATPSISIPTSLPSTTATSLSSGATATPLPSATATSLLSEVTATPPSPGQIAAIPSGILYAIIAVLTLGLILVILYYQQRLNRF